MSPAVRVRVLGEITIISTARRTMVAPVSAKTYPKRNDGLDALETCINVGHVARQWAADWRGDEMDADGNLPSC